MGATPVKSDLTIGEVAARSGVATSALRFYEERGLITCLRNSSGHRRYHRSVLRRVAFVVFAQKLGLTLEEVGQQLAKLPHNSVPLASDWRKLSSTWVRRIDEQIAQLETLRNGLTQCIGCGCLSLEKCKLSNPRDRLAPYGPGPTAWKAPQRKRRPLRAT